MTALFETMMTGLDEVEKFLAGKTAGYRVTLPAEVDVKAIRKRLKMTQARFSDTFGFSLDAVKHWEGGRRTPESSARAFLIVIAKDPKAVISALHQPAGVGEVAATKSVARVAAAQKGRWRNVVKAGGRARRGKRKGRVDK